MARSLLTCLSMYETGEWADLTIEAQGGKLFKVHKTIVCPALPFFHAACTAGFRETHTNHIKLLETNAVVDAILRHFYGVPAAWTEEATYGTCEQLQLECWQDLIRLRTAADKVL